MRVLVAVLSSRQAPWGAMIDTSKATWDSVDVPDVETIYYVGEPASELKDQVVGFPVKESYRTMGHKNLAAWKWMLDNREWDFMARVNASCFVHKPRLKALCDTLPPSGLVYGSIVPDPGNHNNPEWLWGGHQFILSRDVVRSLVDNAHVWPHHLMDDVALSNAAKNLGFKFTQAGHSGAVDDMGDHWRVVCNTGEGFTFTEWEEVRKITTPVFFRVKQDLKRDRDAVVMKHLHDQYHPYEVQEV